MPPVDEEEEGNGAPAPTFTEKLERELETKKPDVWLKRIFWTLVLIALMLAVRLD